MRYEISLFLLSLMSLFFFMCSTNDESVTDGGSADTDSDTDSDTDPHEWIWSSVDIPNTMSGHLGGFHLWVAANDDVYLCGGFINAGHGGGGIGFFNGETLSVEVDNSERFTCNGLWGLDSTTIFAFGWHEQYGTASIMLRNAGIWEELNIADSTDCKLEMMYNSGTGNVMLVGKCDTERRVWELVSGDFEVSDADVPDQSRMAAVLGSFVFSSGRVFFGTGKDGESGLAPDKHVESDINYPSTKAFWAAKSAGNTILAIDGKSFLGFDGGNWSELAGCPEEIEDPPSCWRCGALGNSDDVFLGGGLREGESANEKDNRRLYYFSKGTLTRIIEPCDSSDWYCGVDDVAVGSEKVYAIVRKGVAQLIWADSP